MFCKTCGKLLVPKKTPYGNWLSCPNGHYQPELNQDNPKTVKSATEQQKSREILQQNNPLAIHPHTCKKCGHNKAELIEIQPFYSDEDTVFRMKCGQCGQVEQLEGKVQ